MPDSGSAPDTAINGDPASLLIRRSLLELRDGRAVLIADRTGAHVGACLETAGHALLERIRAGASGSVTIALPSTCARWMGFDAPGDGIVELEDPTGTLAAQLAASPPAVRRHRSAFAGVRAVPAHPRSVAAVSLAKLGRLRPLMLVAPAQSGSPHDLVSVDAEACDADCGSEWNIDLAASASVPLRGGLKAAFHVFRQVATGDEHVAVVVGDTASSDMPVGVRMHSACLTGDLFGSLRCDCGDQLRAAIDAIADEGRGVLLYLAQEGRGIGLANKLRAYELQDQGLDTVDADAALGFGEDERRYEVAAAILKALGIRHVRLKTNNPRKVEALAFNGIVVAGRDPLLAPVNAHNFRYLRAKAIRSGHILGAEVFAGPDDQSEPADQR